MAGDKVSLVDQISGSNSANHSQDIYAGKTKEQKDDIRDFRVALEINRDFNRPFFQDGVRYYRLFAGVLPPEIDGTFSKVMLSFPYAIVDTELVQYMKAMMMGDEWLRARALSHRYEPDAKTVTRWLKFQMQKVQQFQKTAIPTMQSTSIFGNGYRLYSHSYVKKTVEESVANVIEMGMVDPAQPVRKEKRTISRGVIAGEYINYFNVLPSPSGGEVNPSPGTLEAGLDNLIVYVYPTKEWFEGEVKKGNFDKDETARMLKTNGTNISADHTMEYKQELTNFNSGWNQFSTPEWIQKMNSMHSNLTHRYRAAFFFQRDKWMVIGEDNYVLYSGKPLLDNGIWPLANFRSGYDLDSFHGVSLLGVVEDLLISMILNFNMRLDYLAGKFYPPKYAPQALIDELGGDTSALDWQPYKVIPYQHQAYAGRLQEMIFSDESADMDQQAFVEQDQMNNYLEDVIAQHGSESISGNTATVGQSLISKDVARSMQRALIVDETGVRDSASLTLLFGAKYVNDNEIIDTGADGLPWEKIDHQAINEGYGIEVAGARSMVQAEETFKRQLSVAPMLLGDPDIRGQVEMKRQILSQGRFKDVDLIVNGAPDRRPTPQNTGRKMPGGVPSSQNEARSVRDASTVTPQGAFAL